jgi:hypothetical protein
MIKIYTKTEFLLPEKDRLFFPLLVELYLDKTPQILERYCLVDSPEECDVLVLPLTVNYCLENGKTDLVNYFKTKAKELNKHLWVYSPGDMGLTMNEDKILVFRMSDYKSFNNHSTVIMPAFFRNPYPAIYNNQSLAYQSKTPNPIVGYVGHAKGGILKFLTTFINYLKVNLNIFLKKQHSDYFIFYHSSFERLKWLKKIASSKNIETHFIYRDKYRAGAKTQEEKQKTTLEFYDNIKDSQYTFCMRGGGNFSVRLYETLAFGRIPIFIDTDCTLPLEQIIDWSKHCLIIKENELSQVKTKIIDFHNSLSDEQFIEIQKSNYVLREEYLTRSGFFTYFHDVFLKNKL